MVTRDEQCKAMTVDRGMIKFVDFEGLTRRVLVRKNCDTAMTFESFTEHIRRAFGKGERICVKYCRDGGVVVVDDEVGWEETSMSLIANQTLPVVIDRLVLPEKPWECKGTWTQTSRNSIGNPAFFV